MSRTKAQMKEAKKLLRKPPGKFVPVDLNEYPEFGHGKGVKADDCCVAYVDYHCHCLLDGANDFDKEWLEGQFHKANTRTMRILFRNGIVK